MQHAPDWTRRCLCRPCCCCKAHTRPLLVHYLRHLPLSEGKRFSLATTPPPLPWWPLSSPPPSPPPPPPPPSAVSPPRSRPRLNSYASLATATAVDTQCPTLKVFSCDQQKHNDMVAAAAATERSNSPLLSEKCAATRRPAGRSPPAARRWLWRFTGCDEAGRRRSLRRSGPLCLRRFLPAPLLEEHGARVKDALQPVGVLKLRLERLAKRVDDDERRDLALRGAAV